MKKEIWGFNVIGPQGLDAHNDFAVGPNDEGDDVVLRINKAELTGKEFETLKEIAEGGPTPGGSGAIIEQDLDAIGFIPVANTYYQQKSGQKPEPQLMGFEVGDVLHPGDKIHIDVEKEAEFEAWIKNTLDAIPGEQPMYKMLDRQNASVILYAQKLPGAMFGVQKDVYFLACSVADLKETDGALYISEDLTSLDPAFTQGWHLDDNGDVIIEDNDGETYTIEVINDTNPATWNGIFAGMMEEPPASQFIDGVIYFYDGEEYHAITGDGGEGTLDYNKLENVPIINLTENKTTVLSPFEVGQVLNSESVLHIDTNKEEEFLSYLQTLEYPEQIPVAAFMRAKRTADSNLILLLATHQDNVYMLAIGRVGEDSKTLYVSQDFYDEQTSTQYYKGFQNLDANGNLQFTQLLTPADGDFIIEQIVDTNPPTWNGAIISSATEGTVVSPTPVDGEFYKRNGQIYKYTAAKPAELEAFEVGQALSQGDKIHFDTTKGDELAEYLRGLEYDSYSGHVFMDCGGKFKIDADNPADNVYVLALTDMGGSSQNFPILYATDVIEGMITTPGFQYGEHELDNNGDYTLLAGYTIATINDTNPPQWNGVFAGIMGEPQPELYDKVVLESELGSGSGAVIIDLGEITEEQGTIDLTEEQYNLIIGNPDVILRAKLNLGAEVINVYAQKQAGAINNDVEEEVICGVTFQGLNFNCTVKPEGHSDDKYVCKYVTTEEFVGPILYRHDIKISCSGPSVFTVYLTAIYYTDGAVDTITALGNMLNWHDNYMANGYYNSPTALLPITCINMNSKTVSYLDGANEQTASFDDHSIMTITDSVTTLAK